MQSVDAKSEVVETERQKEIRSTVADIDRDIAELQEQQELARQHGKEAEKPFVERFNQLGMELRQLLDTRDKLAREFDLAACNALEFKVGDTVEYRVGVIPVPCSVLLAMPEQLVIQPTDGHPFVVYKSEVAEPASELPNIPWHTGNDDYSAVPF